MKTTKLRSDLARIRTVIEGDRKNVSLDVEKMLKYDITCVLEGYFDILTPPVLEIFVSGGRVNLCITASARNVKNAGVKPSDGGSL